MIDRPTPEQIRASRESAGLTQHQAAMRVGLKSGMRWSEYERGERRPHPVLWELWLLRTGQHPTHMLIERPQPSVCSAVGPEAGRCVNPNPTLRELGFKL